MNYVIVHLAFYELAERGRVAEALEKQHGLRHLGHDEAGIEATLVYELAGPSAALSRKRATGPSANRSASSPFQTRS